MLTREQGESLSSRLPEPVASSFRAQCLRWLEIEESVQRVPPAQRLRVVDLRTGLGVPWRADD
jgi:hypothetical protein